MSVPVGITVPKLLPITGTFAPAFAGYFLLLSSRVSQQRIKNEKFIGDKNDKVPIGQVDPLQVAVRSHSNFVENVPLALLLGAVVEMNGGNRRVLTGGFAALFIARILHVELGLRAENASGNGRLIGHLGTSGFVIGMAGYAAWLVKGYWGL